MGRQVCIASAGYSEHASKRSDVNMPELVSEAIEDCLKKVPGMGFDDIDAFACLSYPVHSSGALVQFGRVPRQFKIYNTVCCLQI